MKKHLNFLLFIFSSFFITNVMAQLTVIDSIVNPSCNAGEDGSIFLSVSGGATPYTYTWDNGVSQANNVGLSGGTYYISISDNGGLDTALSYSVTDPPPIVISTSVYNDYCHNSSGSISTNATNGTAPYYYIWNNGEAGNSISGLSTGIYVLTVMDSNGCEGEENIVISTPAQQLTDSIVLSSSPSCSYSSDGIAEVFPIGGISPYTYYWDSGNTLAIDSNLSNGYTVVQIYDSAGCVKTDTVYFNQQPIISSFATQRDCGNSSGSINSISNGGAPPYSYIWSNGAISQNISGIATGLYSVTVSDANNCVFDSSVFVLGSNGININTTVTNVNCGQCNGEIMITAGDSSLSYLWSTLETSNSLDSLCAGNYLLSVTDTLGCIKDTTFAISNIAGLNVTLSSAPTSCFGGNNGSISTLITGGTSPFTYLWSNSEDSTTLVQLVAGNYSVTVTDGLGCGFIGSTNVNQPDSIEFNISTIATDCGATGWASCSVSGGTSPYSYIWSNGETGSNQISNLNAGVYLVSVIDNNGCSGFSSPINIGAICNNGAISGTVYNDINGNGIQDPTEPPMAGVYVYANGMYWGLTNSNGNYHIPVPTDNFYQVTPFINYTWTGCGYFSSETDTANINVTASNPIVSGVHLGVTYPDIQCGVISGFVFDDINGNGTQDNGETGLASAPIKLGSGIITYTNAAGGFKKNVPHGTYNVELQEGINYHYYCYNTDGSIEQTYPANNGTYPVTIDALNDTSANNNFGGIKTVVPEAGLYSLGIYGGIYIGEDFHAWSDFKISDAFSDTCILTIYHDPYVSLINSSIPVTSTTDTSAIWVFTNLGQYYVHCMQMTWHLDANTPDGYVLNWYETIGCLGAPDPCPNNDSLARTAVANAPNRATDDFNGMFSYTNAGEMPIDIFHADSTFSYEIHYQNTSEDTAYNMLIFDTLPPELNVATLSKAFGSHPHKYSVISDNVILWEFEGINLPDTGTSYIDSYGFVQYNIRMHPNLPMGTIINNNATVIFNQEPATKTNTVTHAIVNTTGVENQNTHTNSVSVYPNPTSGNIVLEIMNFELNNKAYVTITNAVGQIVYQSNISNSTFNISLNEPNGIYFMNVQLNNKMISKRIAISK